MDIQEERVIKLCSFYVSDWHLVTMLLPYINRQINEETKVVTILENSIEENIKTLVSRLHLKNEEKVLAINWNKKDGNKYKEVEKLINGNIGNNIFIIVNGNKEYIDNVDKNIKKYIEENKDKLEKTNTKMKIADCYEIVEFNGSITEILDEHDKILNTSGEKEINEVFEDYNKKQKIS